jgi:crotonobetainyl-CoA:carnitine CoA-transferase CaiB-like acyl-CoA transferase
MIAPYQAFPAADGWLLIAAPSDAMFARLTQALGVPALAADDRFRDNPARVGHRTALVEAVSALTRERKRADLLETLRRHDVPCAPVLTLDAVLEEPQTRESGMLLDAPHARLGRYTSVALPIEWDGRRPGVRREPPRLGEHSEDVLTWLGYTRDDVRALRGKGVIS